jgi:hypothetical protein
MRSGRHRDGRPVGPKKQRRKVGIGRRREPGLQLGAGGGRAGGQGGGECRQQAERRVIAGNAGAGGEGDHEPTAQRAPIVPGQAGMRQADAKPANLARGAGDMRPPQRRAGGVVTGVIFRRAIGEDGERPVPQTRASFKPPIRRRRIRGGNTTQTEPKQRERRQPGRQQQPELAPRRQAPGDIKQGKADEQADYPERRPQRRPRALEEDDEPGECPARGEAAEEAVEFRLADRFGVTHASHSGMSSSRHSTSMGWRARIGAQR